MSWHVETSDRLTFAALQGLRTEEFAALRIPMYCSAETAERIANLLVAHPSRTNYQARWALGDEDGVRLSDQFSRTDVDRIGPTDSAPLPHAVLSFDDAPRVTLQTWLLMDDALDVSVRLLN